jgi:sugar lactone lactonase YvrE/dienelactone hydrolase
MTKLVDLSLPAAQGKMRDWQSVVLGGAIINGLSLEGVWPKAELEGLVSEHPEWKARWDRALELSKHDAYDPKIPAGTRYDAIRVLAMLPAQEAIWKIVPFLESDYIDPAIAEELQMGAVSALGDIDDHGILEPLLDSYSKLTIGNQEIARQALRRTQERRIAWDIYQSEVQEELYRAIPMTLDHAFTEGIEGPASDRLGNVYAVNFHKQQTIGKVDRWGSGMVWGHLPKQGVGNGIVLDSQGDLIVADYVEHKIWRIDKITQQPSLLCHEPKMHQPNDVAICDDGTLYASDPNWSDGTGRVWRIDRQGIATVVADGMGTTNGIDVSPDGKFVSVNESQQRKIWRFEIRNDGTLGPKNLLKEFFDYGFDGMRYDQLGNLYVTRYGKGTVVVLSPAGEVLREIDVLGARPSNLCFGGKDGKSVFVTEVEHGRLVRFRAEHPGRVPRWNPDHARDLWQQQRLQTQSRFDELLGPMPTVGKVPSYKVLSEELVDGVVRKRLRIEIEEGVGLDAYLLVPQGASTDQPRPGMIAFHPTNSLTIDEIAGVGVQGPRATGLEFAKLGYIVICPKCFLWQDVKDFDEAVINHRLRHPDARGIAKMVYDAQRAVDVLMSMPQVDPKRVFAFGHSLGAKEVLYLMAKDSRILAGVASEGGLDLKSTNWEAPWYLGPAPRLGGVDWGHDELLELIAPRPLLVMGGQQGPGAVDGTQSLGVMRLGRAAWEHFEQRGDQERSAGSQDAEGLILWNHGQGHLFGQLQFERARQWFELIGSR